MTLAKIIAGNIHTDDRGIISFVNDFDMLGVRRFYAITPKNTSIIRSWQGHKVEEKWMFCIKGRFLLKTIKVDNWEAPSKEIEAKEYVLTDNKSQLLHIPGGYVNGFKALEKDSTLLVFSNAPLSKSLEDDYRFKSDYWKF